MPDIAAAPEAGPAPAGMAQQEWQVRVDTAACYRLLHHFGLTDMIFTHVTGRVPGADHHILINPYGLFFAEVTPANLVRCDLDGVVQDGADATVNPIGFGFHAAVHRARPDAGCVIHTHSRAGIAVSALERGLLPLTQTALRFKDRVAYHTYEGVIPDPAELGRMVAALGDKPALILHNHGLLTVGRTVAEAFHLIYYLEEACRLQLDILTTGEALVTPAPEVQAQAAAYFQQHTHIPGHREWPALLRMLDRTQAGWRG